MRCPNCGYEFQEPKKPSSFLKFLAWLFFLGVIFFIIYSMKIDVKSVISLLIEYAKKILSFVLKFLESNLRR